MTGLIPRGLLFVFPCSQGPYGRFRAYTDVPGKN